MADYVVALEGLSDSRSLESLPREVLTAASRAINRTADRARTSSARRILEQVALPPSYLNPSGGRLTVSKKASSSDLEAVITGRQRPTSLARFSTSGAVGDRNGVTVTVASGFARFMRRAFLIRLRAGTADLDTKSNLGLAVRLRPGETPQNKKVVRLGNGLWLLYGPSVDQVFQTVREDVSPEALDFLETEFSRLLEI